MYSDGNAGEPILARCEGKFFLLTPPLKSRPRVFVFVRFCLKTEVLINEILTRFCTDNTHAFSFVFTVTTQIITSHQKCYF